MFKTKAEMPEKYREDVRVLDSGVGLQLLAKLNDVVRASLPALEGEYTELPEGSEHPDRVSTRTCYDPNPTSSP